MRNFIKAGLVLLIAGVVMTSACSSDKPSGTVNGTGGATGAGGTDGGGIDAPTGAGGAGGTAGAAGGAGTGGAGGASVNAHQDHLNIINKVTSGGMTVTRPAPIPYDTCKI